MGLTLDLNWRVTLLSAVVLPVLISLGVWQLQRAEEKRQVLAAFQARQQQPPQPLTELDPKAVKTFTPVRLRGRFHPEKRLLLDNRIYNGRVGYEVLEPFEYHNGGWVLVNRGWVEAPQRRDQKPSIAPVPDGELSVTGRLHRLEGERFQLAEEDFEGDTWPLVIQNLYMAQLSERLNRPLYPHTVRIAPTHPAALVAHWQPVVVKPEKHLGYAVQWFSMAAALVIWFIFANTNLWQLIRNRNTPEE